MTYDFIIVGTGFASSFFLKGLLEKVPPNARILVLERGPLLSVEEQIDSGRLSPVAPEAALDLSRGTKSWPFTLAFGGSSNCWWGNTPRMLPSDFRMRSLYGVGRDWPVGYDELEPFYSEAEEIMQVSGSAESDLWPRSRPFPQPPHRATDPERVLRKAHPGLIFALPTARARVATETRPACCATGVCHTCPIRAKFTIAGDMAEIFEDPRVTMVLGAEVTRLSLSGGRITGVEWTQDGVTHEALGDAVALGANAFFNAAILIRSGLSHPLLGRRLHEQIGLDVVIDLDGVDNFSGSTSITGHGYMLYDGPHRSEAAAGLIETRNIPSFRAERGKWRQTLLMKVIFEHLPRESDRLWLDDAAPGRPVVEYEEVPSSYVVAGRDRAQAMLPDLLSALPVERIAWSREWVPTEAHNLGTVVMGENPTDSIVDHQMRHHEQRDLFVLGGSAFPTGAPANPTLTICALSLRAASLL
ncbi:MAG: GMC family oxidoreductase [Pseudomonadota bacterium]